MTINDNHYSGYTTQITLLHLIFIAADRNNH